MILYDTMELIKHNIIIHPFSITIFTLLFGIWLGMFLEAHIKFWEWGKMCPRCKDMAAWNKTKTYCESCFDETCNDEWQAGYDQAKRS